MERRKDLSLALRQKQKKRISQSPADKQKKESPENHKKRGENKDQKIWGKVFNGSGQDQHLGMVRI